MSACWQLANIRFSLKSDIIDSICIAHFSCHFDKPDRQGNDFHRSIHRIVSARSNARENHKIFSIYPNLSLSFSLPLPPSQSIWIYLSFTVIMMLELFTVDMDYVSCAIKRYETYWHKLLTTLPCHANKLHFLMKLYVDWLTTTATTHDNDEKNSGVCFLFCVVKWVKWTWFRNHKPENWAYTAY